MTRAIARRDSFLNRVGDLVQAGRDTEALDYVTTYGPTLGRTDRWLAACRWYDTAAHGDDVKPSWITLQGLVVLAQAVD